MIFLDTNIKFLIEQSKSSGQVIGDNIGMSRQAINQLKNLKTKPSLESFIQIGKYFNISLDDLVYKDLSKQ